jgi:hypothetical protein
MNQFLVTIYFSTISFYKIGLSFVLSAFHFKPGLPCLTHRCLPLPNPLLRKGRKTLKFKLQLFKNFYSDAIKNYRISHLECPVKFIDNLLVGSKIKEDIHLIL